MNTPRQNPLAIGKSGFTLIEMIGVLAIMGVLAAVITPNALRALDRTAIRTEAETLRSLASQVKVFLRARGWPPGLNPVPASRLTWDRDLGNYTDISPADLLTNKRQMARSYIYEPVASPKRVLILSSMRAGLALPTAANLNTMALFDNVWNTPDGSVPPAAGSWTGWAAWRNTLNGTAGDYLVIERVNLNSIYATDLQTISFTLNNRSPQTVSYSVAGQTPVNIPPPVAPATNATLALSCRPGDRINLYRSASGANLDYSYVVPQGSGGRTFDFTGSTNWVPQP